MPGFGQSSLGSPFVINDAQVVERCLIKIEQGAIGSQYIHELRREIQNLSQLYLLRADFFFRNFALFNFNARAVPFDDLIGFVTQWFFTMKEPAIFSVSPPHA